MIRLQLQESDNVIEALNKIKNITDLNIELIIPKNSVLFENVLNLKIIQQQADKLEKSVEFVTEDEAGSNLVASVTGKGVEVFMPEEEENLQTTAKEARKFSIPKINLPKFSLHFPSFFAAKKSTFIAGAVFLIILVSYIFYGSTAPKANAKIVVHSQALTRSVTIKVKADVQTDVKNKILRGTTLTTLAENSLEKDSTGTKIVGDKAKGTATIYNKTSSDIKLSKNHKLTYKGKSTDLNYYTQDDVTIPGSVADDSNPGENISGEVNVDITASDIGGSYNIDKDKSLSVSGYKSADMAGKTKTDISGGKSETIKVVAIEDRTNISNDLKTQNIQKANSDLTTKLGSSQKIVAGSVDAKIVKETYSKNVGDEADKISLTQSVNASGLVYLNSELNSFLDEYVKDVIPQGFVLSAQDREVKVEVLGNSTSSILNSKEADLQVTLKTLVIPDIKEEDIKNSLKGKSPEEATKILGAIKNVNSLEFNLKPVLPFFQKVPNDLKRITVTIVKQ